MKKEKSQFHDCPICGAGGIIPDEYGRCTHCDATIVEIKNSESVEKSLDAPQCRADDEDKRQELPTIKATSGKEKGNVKKSLLTRFFRVLCIIWFILAMQICILAVGMFSESLGEFLVLLLLGVISILLSVVLVRRLSFRISEHESRNTYDPWLIAISIAAMVVWGKATTIIIPSFVNFLAFLIGFFGAIGVLFMSRPFYLRNYFIAGLAIVSCLASIQYPVLLEVRASVQASIRSQAFADIITECQELASSTEFDAGLNKTGVLREFPDTQKSVLILMSDEKYQPRKLNVAHWEYYVPRQFIVPKHELPKLIIVEGPAAPIQDTIKGVTFLRPVVLYSWPAKEHIKSDVITATYRKRSSSPDLWGEMFFNRQIGSEIERIIVTR